MQVPPVVPYKALEKFPKALCGTTVGTYGARIFRHVMVCLRLSVFFLQDNLVLSTELTM